MRKKLLPIVFAAFVLTAAVAGCGRAEQGDAPGNGGQGGGSSQLEQDISAGGQGGGSSQPEQDTSAGGQGERTNLILTAHGGPMRVLNMFLSSFSEVRFAVDEPFSGSETQMIDFAFLHNLAANSEAVQYDNNTMSIPEATITATVQEYFNKEVTPQSTPQFTLNDGRYESPAATGESYDFCTVADELYENADGTYDVHFVVFGTPYDTSEEAMSEYYIYFIDDARSDASLTEEYTGTAKLGRRSDEGGYYLISYSCDPSK